jgi:hypothetical protein
LPMVFAVLLPLGLMALLRSGQPLRWVIAAGFFAAPLVSVISGAIEMNRVMFAIPFAVLVATAGLVALWDQRLLTTRVLCVALAIAVPFQFVSFHRSYMSEAYRISAATWFSGNPREALRELIARSGDSPIYISQEIEWVHRMWRFYAIEAGRLDLMARTTYFRELPGDVPSNAKLLCPAESASCAALASSGAWRNLIVVPSIDAGHRYVILERLPASQHGD